MDIEKQQTPRITAVQPKSSKGLKWLKVLAVAIYVGISLVQLAYNVSSFNFKASKDSLPIAIPSSFTDVFSSGSGGDDSLCPISEKLVPKHYEEHKDIIDKILHDEKFRNSSAAKLGNAVKIPTEMKDGWKDVDADYFKPFAKLHKYFEEIFPEVHSKLKLEKVNKYGLVYTWTGSNSTLKPLLLAAHQDVVPVEWKTESRWSYYPYSGYFDGTKVWGRGSTDCKSLLIGLLESVELLLQKGFSPKRTIVLAFGYDEEASGSGAGHIADFLLERYGQNSFYAVIDEGNGGVLKKDDVFLSSVATGEKGYNDNIITLTTPGGHSSVPPDHTSIGIVSELISKIENTPFEPILSNINPYFGYLQCYASHSKSIDTDLKKDILKASVDSKANSKVVEYLSDDIETRYFIKTSQATDIINGGVKANALPESVSVLVNTRISVDSNVKEVTDKITGNILEVADKFNLGLVREGKVIKPATDNGYFNYTFMDPLEVAPVTPWSGDVWDTYTGTLRYFYEDVAYPKEIGDNRLVITPGISTGNTDTKSYWKLTNNIYRAEPGALMLNLESSGVHSVDEFVSIESHLNIIAFYYIYLRNIDNFAAFDHE